jgi:hypothetical protein
VSRVVEPPEESEDEEEAVSGATALHDPYELNLRKSTESLAVGPVTVGFGLNDVEGVVDRLQIHSN